jgi:acyl-coenzyme A synthetase/AMP-(fatty) acid ligase
LYGAFLWAHRALNSPNWRFSARADSAGEREGLNVFFPWECLRPLLQGYPAYIIPDKVIVDPKALVNYLEANRVTRLLTTPNLIEHILDYPGLDVGRKLKALRFWFLQGEAAPATTVHKMMERVPNAELWNIYGTWEVLNVSYARLDRRITWSKFAPVGKAMLNVTCYLLDEAQRIRPGLPGVVKCP